MIHQRLLTKDDEAALRAFLMRDPLYNLFMIGDLEMMGFGAEDLCFWGQFSPGGELIGAAMRYRVNWCFYASTGCDVGAFARLVDDHPGSHAVNGHPRQVDPIVAQLERYTVHELHASYFCRLALNTTVPTATWPTRRAVPDDADALAELYSTAGFMQRDAASLRRTLEQGGRVVVATDNDRIVSGVLTTVETSNAAMIGGVFTPEPWRNRGYASAAMSHLCAELVAARKQPCLFYNNPAAGAIYRRLGFEDIGPWNLVLLKPCPADKDL
jgi:predicted GNAT family acetyltransferase